MLLATFVVLASPTVSAQTLEDGSIIVSVQTKKKTTDYTFTSVAVSNLKLLREVVVEMGVSQHLQTLQAIMMVETRAGTGGSIGLPTAHPSRRSYGLMQLTVPTARVLFRDNDSLRQQFFGDRSLSQIHDKEIIKLLLTNPKLNIRLGITLFVQYLDMVQSEWARAVAAYNMGIGNALKRKEAPRAKYVSDVRQWTPVVVALNAELDKPQNDIEDTIIAQEENNNGKIQETSETLDGTIRQQSGEQSGRAEEIQDSFGYDYRTSSGDRPEERIDQGSDW